MKNFIFDKNCCFILKHNYIISWFCRSTTGSLGVYQRKKDLKKLLGYMAYGWGMPLILSLLIYGLSITESLSDTIRPYIGTKSCFLERSKLHYHLSS